jgi:hypothetical protein
LQVLRGLDVRVGLDEAAAVRVLDGQRSYSSIEKFKYIYAISMGFVGQKWPEGRMDSALVSVKN